MLRAKLYERQVLQREEELKQLQGEKKEIAWGSQIRDYVFQPYTMVRDHRTEYKLTDIQSVMDGGLKPFVNRYLKRFG